ncbi:MAG: cell division protein FtsZ [Solirubrobacteraceae bacterium]
MASAKQRASMREGPLAALFRKTEEQDQPAERRSDAGASSEPSSGDASPAPASSGAARTERSETSADAVAEDREEVEERRAAPHPSLRGDQAPPGLATPLASPTTPGSPAPRTDAARAAAHEPQHARTPKERLLDAFSAEIPANIMDVERARPPVSSRRHPESSPPPQGRVGHPVIRVVGVGGGGTNAVNRMVEAEIEGVEFLAVNTDVQSLQQSSADVTVHIGVELTRGLGSGSDANVGRQAAMDDYDRVKTLLKGSDMIFIAAGAGGGTGTGAAPIVARIAREVGALAVAIVTRPFGFEGSRRATQAEHGIAMLAQEVDTLIVVPNDRLLSILDKQTSIVDAFKVADDVLRQGVQGVSDLVTLPGLINLDFADVRTIMSDAGNALLGIGMGVGENRAVEAAMQAVASPLLETSMEGARSILLSITGGADLSLWEVNEAAKAVSEAAHPDANIIFGAMVDQKLEDQVWVTVVATGYGERRSAAVRDEPRERGSRFQEPHGEPRIKRAREPLRSGARRSGGGLVVDEYDIPEFLPRL